MIISPNDTEKTTIQGFAEAFNSIGDYERQNNDSLRQAKFVSDQGR